MVEKIQNSIENRLQPAKNETAEKLGINYQDRVIEGKDEGLKITIREIKQLPQPIQELIDLVKDSDQKNLLGTHSYRIGDETDQAYDTIKQKIEDNRELLIQTMRALTNNRYPSFFAISHILLGGDVQADQENIDKWLENKGYYQKIDNRGPHGLFFYSSPYNPWSENVTYRSIVMPTFVFGNKNDKFKKFLKKEIELEFKKLKMPKYDLDDPDMLNTLSNEGAVTLNKIDLNPLLNSEDKAIVSVAQKEKNLLENEHFLSSGKHWISNLIAFYYGKPVFATSGHGGHFEIREDADLKFCYAELMIDLANKKIRFFNYDKETKIK